MYLLVREKSDGSFVYPKGWHFARPVDPDHTPSGGPSGGIKDTSELSKKSGESDIAGVANSEVTATTILNALETLKAVLSQATPQIVSAVLESQKDFLFPRHRN